MTREELTEDAEKYIRRLLNTNPRAAILVSAVFMEHRLLTLLTSRIAPHMKNERKEIRSFLDEKFTIGPLVRLAKVSKLLSVQQAKSFNRILNERNNLAHHYSAWRKFTTQRRKEYAREWTPDCLVLLRFMKETTET